MIFLTIGTLFEFERLVQAVDKIAETELIQEDIFAQIGPTSYKPRNMEYVDYLNKIDFEEKIRVCTAMISHAGMGSISMALDHQKPLLVLPRLKKYGEHVNDHQLDSAQKFEQLGHILAVYDTDELANKVRQLKTFVPKPRIPNRQGVVDCISEYISSISKKLVPK